MHSSSKRCIFAKNPRSRGWQLIIVARVLREFVIIHPLLRTKTRRQLCRNETPFQISLVKRIADDRAREGGGLEAHPLGHSVLRRLVTVDDGWHCLLYDEVRALVVRLWRDRRRTLSRKT